MPTYAMPGSPRRTTLSHAPLDDARTQTGDVRRCTWRGDPERRLKGLLAHLRTSLAEHVHERRAAGHGVERVVGEVRSLVGEAESCEALHDASPDALRSLVLQWTVEAYGDMSGPDLSLRLS